MDEGTQVEQDSPHDQGRALFGKLVDVFFGGRVAPVQSPFEEMRKLVELAELPLGIWGVLPRSDGRGVLVELLSLSAPWSGPENFEDPRAHVKIAEERVDQEVDDDKRRQDSVEDSHEYEPSLESTQSAFGPRSTTRPPSSPLNQILPPLLTHKLLPHLAPPIKQIPHQTKPQIPLQRLGQRILTKRDKAPFALIAPRLGKRFRYGRREESGWDVGYQRVGEGESDAEVEQVFVE